MFYLASRFKQKDSAKDSPNDNQRTVPWIDVEASGLENNDQAGVSWGTLLSFLFNGPDPSNAPRLHRKAGRDKGILQVRSSGIDDSGRSESSRVSLDDSIRFNNESPEKSENPTHDNESKQKETQPVRFRSNSESTILSLPKKSCHFNSTVKVILIPCRDEYYENSLGKTLLYSLLSLVWSSL